MPDCPVVDAHVHFFDPARLSYPWLAGVPAIDKAHAPADHRAAAAGLTVEAMVFVEVDVAEELRFEETAFVAGLARDEPRIAGIVASAPIENGAEATEAEIARHTALGPLKGIRRLIQNRPEPGWCLAPAFVDGVRVLARHGLTFDICIRSHQLADATELVRRCPEVAFVLDHVGKPDIAGGEFEPWASGIRAMAALPNVVCKLSGVITEADPAAWTFEGIRPYVDHAFACFGPGRTMFASDWPVVNLAGSLAQWVAVLDRVLEGESEAARRAFWRDTAIRTYRLGI